MSTGGIPFHHSRYLQDGACGPQVECSMVILLSFLLILVAAAILYCTGDLAKQRQERQRQQGPQRQQELRTYGQDVMQQGMRDQAVRQLTMRDQAVLRRVRRLEAEYIELARRYGTSTHQGDMQQAIRAQAVRRRERRLEADQIELARRYGTSTHQGDIESHPPPSSPNEQELGDLELSELMDLYNKAFARSKRQTILLPCDVFHGNPTKAVSTAPPDAVSTAPPGIEQRTDEEEQPAAPFDWSIVESIRDHAEDPTIDAALQSARSICRTENEEDSVIGPTNEYTTEHKSNYLVHPESESLHFVGGICMICLEEMKVGDTVVWSESPSCPHMYHKDCLVSFFAHNYKEQRRLPSTRRDIGHDPCPACRTNFVTTKC